MLNLLVTTMKATYKNVFLTFLYVCIIIYSCHTHAARQKGDCTSRSGGESKVYGTEKLYHATSGQCHEFATRGPCGENMIFYKHPFNPRYGFCDCDQGFKSPYPCKDYPVRKMIYVPSRRKCFPIFSQGPCKDGFWINYDTDSSVVRCQPNPCLLTQSFEDPNYDWKTSGSVFWFYDSLRNSCFITQTQGYCPVGQTLEVNHDSHLPKCKRLLCYGQLTKFIRSDLTCKPGSRYSYLWRGCLKTSRYFYGIG